MECLHIKCLVHIFFIARHEDNNALCVSLFLLPDMICNVHSRYFLHFHIEKKMSKLFCAFSISSPVAKVIISASCICSFTSETICSLTALSSSQTAIFIICTKPQAKMPAFSFEAQTQRMKDVCLHLSFLLFSFTLLTISFLLWNIRQKPYHFYIGFLFFCMVGMGVKYRILGVKFLLFNCFILMLNHHLKYKEKFKSPHMA